MPAKTIENECHTCTNTLDMSEPYFFCHECEQPICQYCYSENGPRHEKNPN